MSDSETLQSFVSGISKAIESFAEPGSNGQQVLDELADSDPAIFFVAGIRVASASGWSEGLRYLIQALAKDKRLATGLLDSNVCNSREAVAIAQFAGKAGLKLQSTLEVALNKALQGQSSPKKTERVLRILELLGLDCDPARWNSLQVELMSYPDKFVRAKAALLIGRSTGNVAWIARRLWDRDPRVQASAVEALWGMNPEEVRPHFLAALKSTNNRVAANAALGLHRSGDVTAARSLLKMLQHEHPAFRLSALWAIGETHDARFLQALTEYYNQSAGKPRLAAVTAMARIRRHDKTAREAGALQINIAQAAAQAEGGRRVVFGLSCHPARDLRNIKATELALWENGTLIEDYQVRLAGLPAVLIAGFIAPASASGQDAYEMALREALTQCLGMKRPGDLWRIDRYSVEMNPPAGPKSPQDSLVPYDDSLMTPELKASQGCITDPELFTKALTLPVPEQRVAATPLEALQRQCDAFAKHGGKRHVFLFLHEMSGADLKQEAAVNNLRAVAKNGSVVLHCISPDIAGQWSLLGEAFTGHPEASFTATTLEKMVDDMVDVYANLCARFEIAYSLPAALANLADSAGQSTVKLEVSSELGYGAAEVALELPAAAETAPASPAEQTVQPAA